MEHSAQWRYKRRIRVTVVFEGGLFDGTVSFDSPESPVLPDWDEQTTEACFLYLGTRGRVGSVYVADTYKNWFWRLLKRKTYQDYRIMESRYDTESITIRAVYQRDRPWAS